MMTTVEKVVFGNIVFNVKIKHGRYHLDFYDREKLFVKKRTKRSTKLLVSPENLDLVKKVIIPEVVEKLTNRRLTVSQKLEQVDEQNNVNYKFEDFSDMFFQNYKHTVREHTFIRRYKHYQNHIKPYFIGLNLSQIKPLDLENWINGLKKKIKVSSIKTMKSILNSILQKAFENELISENPMKRLASLKKQISFEDKDPQNPFTIDELNKILTSDDDNQMLKNFVQLLFWSGIRNGEAIALKWTDCDFKNRFLNITKTKVAGKIGLPKTPSSFRKVDLLPQAIDALKKQFELTGNKSEYIFINKNGKAFFSHDTINLSFKRKLIMLNIPIRPLYNLRSSFASQMISNGADFGWVSKMLGHATLNITMDRYSKYIKESESARLQRLDRIYKLTI